MFEIIQPGATSALPESEGQTCLHFLATLGHPKAEQVKVF